MCAQWLLKTLTRNHKSQKMDTALNCLHCYHVEEEDFMEKNWWMQDQNDEMKDPPKQRNQCFTKQTGKVTVKVFHPKFMNTVFWDPQVFC